MLWGFFAKSLRAERLHHVNRVTSLLPFVRIVRGDYDRWLSDAIFVEDKSKQIVAISFTLETEPTLCFLVRGFCAVLRRTLHLTCLQHSFLRVESRIALVPKLYDDVVVQAVNRGATANVA